MLKMQASSIINYTIRKNLIKSTFRNFSLTICKSKINTFNYSIKYRYLLQQTSIFNATQRSWLSKSTSVPLTKNISVPDNFLEGVVRIDDPERREEVLKIVKLLLKHGCSGKEIKTKCLPHIISTQSSYTKVKLLTNLHPNVVMIMPLLTLQTTSLRVAAKHVHCDINILNYFPTRIEYLAHNLEINIVELIPMLSKHPSLLTMPFQRLQNKMQILKDAQISSEYIVKDLWIFNYNEKLLEKRCSAANEAKIELKPWMLRCSEKFFESMLRKWVQTQEILKGEDELSYLAKQLDCSVDYLKVLMEKNKLLMTINIPKIEQILAFLKGKGYKPQEIRLFPRIFSSSLLTLNKRFEVLHQDKNGTTLPTLSQLCVSSRNFENAYKTKMSKSEGH